MRLFFDPIDLRSSLIYFAGTAPCQCDVIVISDIRSEHGDVSEWAERTNYTIFWTIL